MRIEESLSQTGIGFASTSSIKEQTLEAFRSSREYRHAFVEEAIRSRVTSQIKSLRDEAGLDHAQLAERMGKRMSWVYRLEDPNAALPTIPTLLHVAEAFDISLDVRFRSFSGLLEDVMSLEPASFVVPSFESEMRAGAFWRSRRRRKPTPRAKHRHRSRRGRKPSANHAMPERNVARAGIGAGRFMSSSQLASLIDEG